MNYKAEFDLASIVRWQEEKPKKPDLGHLQGAMFMDRPDLWPVKKPRRKKGSQPRSGQIPFAFFTDPLPGQKFCRADQKRY